MFRMAAMPAAAPERPDAGKFEKEQPFVLHRRKSAATGVPPGAAGPGAGP